MQLKRLILLTSAALVVGAGALTATASADNTLTGAGSGLVAPLEAEWAAAFQSLFATTVSYASVGSLTGINDISSRSVDFAAIDEPLTTSQGGQCNHCYQIPWALSALGIGYHVSGVSAYLHLTPSVLAGIYLGTIKNWNAPQIAADNPRLHLPSTKITPVYQLGSGDTDVFTSYLSAISSTWKSRVGSGATVSFPTGIQANGNSGVTATLESVNGAIAYDGAAYLIAHQLPAAAIQNAAGNYEFPNLQNIDAAASRIKKITKNALHITDPSRRAKNAYPLSTFVYAVVPSNAAQKSLLKQWLQYALGAGQLFGPHLDYGTIPSVVLRASVAAVNQFGG